MSVAIVDKRIGLEDINRGNLERDLQDAVDWRDRIRSGTAHIRDCNKDVILEFFDKALSAARGFRHLSKKE